MDRVGQLSYVKILRETPARVRGQSDAVEVKLDVAYAERGGG
jgi:hypothetical protein